MAKKILESLNPKQKEAVEYCDGPELVLAGAGSGKTRVLTTKIAYLIDNINVEPRSILALTFTNKAAKEMKTRVQILLDSETKDMEISTFHAYGLRFLHRYHNAIEKIGFPKNFVIFDRSDVKSIIKNLLKELDIDIKRLDVGDAIELISRAKTSCNPVTRAPCIDSRWLELYEKYQEKLKAQGALDFDDLLILPLHILATNRSVRDAERARIKWVLVDEYQDVNTPQYLLLRCLVDESKRIMVVGDPDQSIYGWRGANMSMIMNFEKDFKGAKVVVLEQNYRSTGQILDGANGIIRNNNDRHPKNLWTAADRGDVIKIYRAGSDIDESRWVCKKIEQLCEMGYSYKEMAILYRINALSRGMEQSLLENSIPYHVIRGLAFYERMEVKDVLSMMRLAVNPQDSLSLSRIANIPARGIGKKSIEVLSAWFTKFVDTSAENIWLATKSSGAGFKGKAAEGVKQLCDNMLSILAVSSDAHEVINTILYSQGYEEYLRSKHTDDWEERVENIMEILSLVPDEGSIEEILTEIPLFTDDDSSSEFEDSVNLLTLHAAKGLEFPIVFMIGMEEGIFPSARAVEGEGDISEERRLCYVGMTRARERLFMSGAASRLLFGGVQRNTTSRFIGEIPRNCSEIEDATWGGDYHAEDRVNRRRWRW
jgi:DNA helicase-2/ATP-dependent DNA helicase PcrA